MTEVLSVVTYIVGWILFLWLQAHNSTLSKTNSLPTGWVGYKMYLKAHAPDIAMRAFFSALGYGFIVHSVAVTVQNIGFQLQGVVIAGVGGFSANTLCFQFIGLFPGLRSEVSDLAPPANAQIVPVVTSLLSHTGTLNPQSTQPKEGPRT